MKIPPIKITSTEGVNKTDYYSSILLEYLIPFLAKKPSIHSLLEIGAGRGYLSIILAKKFPNLRKIVATDIDSQAVRLVKRNVIINNLHKRIVVKRGNLFEPVKSEKFDLIISVPPQLPLTRRDVQQLLPKVEPYHLTTSVGGKNGRKIVDKIITNAPNHLLPGGIICFAHSDIIGIKQSLERLESQKFGAILLGTKIKFLNETTLTHLSKKNIEKTGYRFCKDDKNQEFFNICVIAGVHD